ncbi:hypothetical protein HPB51_019038 [Rhipicephalus microplus]|uniref:Uncharacterized protein n=1 Tax=Rhipicephalus microplus TaxID=6941 RepID=A0A9J6D7D6_RHIMP|nr:hypothetical protein HPB51_019038 [Rhipicephalus microplus]
MEVVLNNRKFAKVTVERSSRHLIVRLASLNKSWPFKGFMMRGFRVRGNKSIFFEGVFESSSFYHYVACGESFNRVGVPAFPLLLVFDIRNHARTRPRAVNSAVDQLFEDLMNGDVSDAELSDDEVADAQFVEMETASDEEQGPTLHLAESETRHSDSDEPPPTKGKQVN